MNLDEAKLEILKFLDIPTKNATKVEIVYDAKSPIVTKVLYEFVNPEHTKIYYSEHDFVTIPVTKQEDENE